MAESLGFTSVSSTEDGLIAGDFPLKTKPVTIKSGEGVVKRGTLLGKISRELGTPTYGAGNTGDGTIGSIAMGAKTQKGNYLLECTVAATNGGTFKVQVPDGSALPDAEVGTAYSNPHIGFTIADGSIDFAIGDTIVVPVEEPSSELYVKSLAASVDGSEEVDSILTNEVDATSADVLKSSYITGDFNTDKITFGTGHTAASTKEAAEKKSMFWYDANTVPNSY